MCIYSLAYRDVSYCKRNTKTDKVATDVSEHTNASAMCSYCRNEQKVNKIEIKFLSLFLLLWTCFVDVDADATASVSDSLSLSLFVVRSAITFFGEQIIKTHYGMVLQKQNIWTLYGHFYMHMLVRCADIIGENVLVASIVRIPTLTGPLI